MQGGVLGGIGVGSQEGAKNLQGICPSPTHEKRTGRTLDLHACSDAHIPAQSEYGGIDRQVRSPLGPEHTVQGPTPARDLEVSTHPSPAPKNCASVPAHVEIHLH